MIEGPGIPNGYGDPLSSVLLVLGDVLSEGGSEGSLVTVIVRESVSVKPLLSVTRRIAVYVPSIL